jgi:hypothetical protein
MNRHPEPPVILRKTKVFDPADGFGPVKDLVELSDATLCQRLGRWWIFLAGQRRGEGVIALFSGSLPEGAPLRPTGWNLATMPGDPGRAEPLGGAPNGAGGRHCPSYAKGWDPARHVEVERIYYARDAGQPWGPYAIAFLEWDGSRWVDEPEPAFVATQSWENGSVYEPNLIYFNGKWRMWYVAGSNQSDYLIHGYAESEDGRTNWSIPRVFAQKELKIFDFRVFLGQKGYESVFSRVWVGGGSPPAETGLWWCHSEEPAGDLARWSEPVQLMGAADCGWHSGPWKPSVHLDESSPGRVFVFFDGIYPTGAPGPFPFAFTLGCLECRADPGGV